MKVAAHLAAFHGKAASTHSDLSKCYSKIAALGKTSKSDMKDKDGESLADCLQKIVDTHEAAAEFHRSAMEECLKVADDSLGKNTSDLIKRLEHLEGQLIPTRISAITPNAPGVRAVPRAGAQPMPQRPEVPLQFSKLVEIEE